MYNAPVTIKCSLTACFPFYRQFVGPMVVGPFIIFDDEEIHSECILNKSSIILKCPGQFPVRMASFAESENDATCFCLGGAREMVTLERAQELLVPLTGNAKYTKLNLSNKSYSDVAAAAIGEALSLTCTHVVIANISDMIAGRQEEEALRALKSICDGLAECVLEKVECDDNAMGRPGVIACAAVLRQKSLRSLSLKNDGLSGEAAEELAAILLGEPEEAFNCPPLETFHYHNNMSGDEGAIAIARIVRCCPQLKNFQFSTTRTKHKGCLEIAEALASLETNRFEVLDLSDNSFGGPCVAPLGSFLARQSSMTALFLRDSGIGEVGLDSLAPSMIMSGAPMIKLDLSGNDFETECGNALVSIVSKFAPTLEELYLDDNCFESEVGSALAKCIAKCSKLRILHVNNCELTALGAYRLARAVSSIPTFITLEMDGNMICGSGVEAIETLMNSAGKRLVEMEDNDDDGDDDLQGELELEEEGSDGETGLEVALTGAKI